MQEVACFYMVLLEFLLAMGLCIMIFKIISLLEDLIEYLASITFLFLDMLEVLLLSTAMDYFDMFGQVELSRYVIATLRALMLVR